MGPGVGCDVRDRALEQRGVDVHARQRLRARRPRCPGRGRSCWRAPSARPRPARPRGGRGGGSPSGSCWQSSRLPTRELSRSVSSSIVARNSRHLVGVPRDVVLAQAAHRGFDRRQRRPQVVGDRREDRGSQIVDLDAAPRRPPHRASAPGRGRRPRAARRTRRAPGGSRPAAEVRGSRGTCPRRGQRLRSLIGRGRCADPRVGLDEPAAVVGQPQDRHGVQAERGAHVLDQTGQRVVVGDQPAGQMRQRLGLRPPPLRLGSQARRLDSPTRSPPPPPRRTRRSRTGAPAPRSSSVWIGGTK